MKYTIFSINDDRKRYTDAIRKKLLGWEEVPVWSVNGSDSTQLGQAQELHPYQINDSDRPLKVGHLGIWYSVLNALEHAPLVTFEDDAILSGRFKMDFQSRRMALPSDFDFFSLFIPRDSDHLYHQGLSVNPWLTRPYQKYGGVSMFYSEKGANKIKALLERDGITQQYDETLYSYAREGELNGFCSKPTIQDLVYITGNERSIVQESEVWDRKKR